MDFAGMLIVYAFIVCVALSVLYRLIKAAVRDGVKEALRGMEKKDGDDSQ